MEKVTIELDAKWVKLINAPYMHIAWALQGVSVTFAPWFLWTGYNFVPPFVYLILAPLCVATAFLIPLFFFRLGGEVVKELKKQTRAKSS